MDKLVIEGGIPLNGEIDIQGAKNAVLPILAATILAEDECELKNCPRLRDVEMTEAILTQLGCKVRREKDSVFVNPVGINNYIVDEKLMREMRSSIILLGAIISVCKKAYIGLPGGCPIGLRPIDLHIKALKKMGVSVSEEHGYLKCECNKLSGADIHLDFPSVGATENIMLAAVKAEGTTHISNAAREPEISDLAMFLNSIGAKITGAGTGHITIQGVGKLYYSSYKIMPDRIVAQTYLIAAMITRGRITVNRVNSSHMTSVLALMSEMGAKIKYDKGTISLTGCNVIKNVNIIKTMPYPGFPTDIQSPFMALTTLAEGTSVFVENIFENRFRHVNELIRMGADIKVEGRSAVVSGVEKLYGANVDAYELRGGAALTVAALAAEGRTEVTGVQFIDRGYENIENDLAQCGAEIKRIHI